MKVFRIPILRNTMALLLVVVLPWVSSCAWFRADKGDLPLSPPGRIAVMPSPDLPVIELGGYLEGKGEGAAAGAATGGLTCLSALGQGGCTGSICGAAMLMMLAVCGITTIIGGVAGAVTAPDAQVIDTKEQSIRYASYSMAVQKPLRDDMASVALENFADVANISTPGATASGPRDYRFLDSLGVETVLETGLSRITIENIALIGNVDPQDTGNLQLFMEGTLRVIRVRDNQLLREQTVRYHAGPPRSLDEWSRDNGRALQQAMQQAYEPIASWLYNKTFMVYPFPGRGVAGFPIATFGLAPLEPALSLPPFEPASARKGPIDYAKTVSSRKPLLRWERFPRAADRKADPDTMKRVRNVSYDLRIGALTKDAVINTVYERQGLPSPEYRIQIALLPATRYFWIVRARFELDGRQWVTEWSSVWKDGGDHQEPPFPSAWSYQFRTGR